MNVKHLSNTDKWYTPEWLILAAWEVMGGVDLDPASDMWANERIKAKHFYTEETNGLTQPWAGKVFLNPPGGKIKGKSSAALFWSKLSLSYLNGDVTEALFIGFSVECLQTTQMVPGIPITQVPFCVLKRRIKFDYKEGDKKSPSHANLVAYLGKRPYKFLNTFNKFGAIANAPGELDWTASVLEMP